ncbi:gastric triacylglycerol lipase-like isoform X2 [Dermacentor albipictus]|uniref:gastric triacylglycerol lipase-like isoform X2 n=1 Tax=Dermacentor albipictus TaxID=60249 RepID=UPI0038FD0356
MEFSFNHYAVVDCACAEVALLPLRDTPFEEQPPAKSAVPEDIDIHPWSSVNVPLSFDCLYDGTVRFMPSSTYTTKYVLCTATKYTTKNALLVFLVGGTLPSWRTGVARARLLPKDADAEKSIEELIEARGYPVESHQVVTDDGYVLGLYRIPRGRVEIEEASQTRTGMTTAGCDGASRAPVLIMHGLLASAITWVTNYADQSLGYVLADAGYDVWLGNIRGSTLSRKHVNISADSEVRFWNFSFQEMIEYDVPATIDYILRETGKSKLGYVGHSQGTLVMFGLLSAAPAYNDKVALFVALAPIIAPVHSIMIAKQQLLAMSEMPAIRSTVLKIGPIGEHGPPWKEIADKPCRTEESLSLCEATWNTIFGRSVMLNRLIKTGRFCKYDYGAAKNKGIYDQTVPPCYPLEDIRNPVAIFWGDGDALSRPQDIDRIRSRVSSIVFDERVGSGPFSHADFVYGVDAKRVLHDRIVQVLRQFYSMCRPQSSE